MLRESCVCCWSGREEQLGPPSMLGRNAPCNPSPDELKRLEGEQQAHGLLPSRRCHRWKEGRHFSISLTAALASTCSSSSNASLFGHAPFELRIRDV